MYEKFFAKRLATLRIAKGVSARDMSLSIGQSESYINKIENSKSFPSMQIFFYICEYLNVTPREFFDTESNNPILVNQILEETKNMDDEDLVAILEIIRRIANK